MKATSTISQLKKRTRSDDFDLDAALKRGAAFIEVLRKRPPLEILDNSDAEMGCMNGPAATSQKSQVPVEIRNHLTILNYVVGFKPSPFGANSPVRYCSPIDYELAKFRDYFSISLDPSLFADAPNTEAFRKRLNCSFVFYDTSAFNVVSDSQANDETYSAYNFYTDLKDALDLQDELYSKPYRLAR